MLRQLAVGLLDQIGDVDLYPRARVGSVHRKSVPRPLQASYFLLVVADLILSIPDRSVKFIVYLGAGAEFVGVFLVISLALRTEFLIPGAGEHQTS